MGRHPASNKGPHQAPTRPTDAEIERKIIAKIGQPVRFRYPGTEGSRNGILKDRVVIQSTLGFQGIPYWDVVDLIEFPQEPEPLWLRVGYYRYANGKLVWGSQTTLTDPLSVWHRLFAEAKRRPWFMALVRGDEAW